MLKRILEPEAMLSRRDALEYEALDHSDVNAGLADHLARSLNFTGGSLLDLGTGPAGLPVAVCRRIKGATVTAVELAPAMLDLAAGKISGSGLAGRIRLVRADAKKTALPAAAFDFVVCYNLVHHIPEPERLFREAARLCRAGGGLCIQDLRRPDTLKELNALMADCSGDTPRQRDLLRRSYRAALRVDEAAGCAKRAGLTGFTLSSFGPRHWRLERPAEKR